MKLIREFVVNAVVGGLLVILPVYLAALLLLKGMQAVHALVSPIAALLPEGLPAGDVLALLLLLLGCFIVGVLVRTPLGRRARAAGEQAVFGWLPGYEMFRGLTVRAVGGPGGTSWQPALAEIEDALVPAFIIESLPDGRHTVFVPSVPTPLAGAVYILDAARVHAVDVPFKDAVRCVSQWGSGAGQLVAALPAAGRKPPPG